MSLRKSSRITPALLAANRANASRCTGPRTAEGKRRILLNALKHGRYARSFREHLVKAGPREAVELFDWIHQKICACFEPTGEKERRRAERLACQVWSVLCRRRKRKGSKPECSLESRD